ncbi:MAG: glycosyltransferase family 4 protein [Planctomycetota bacterium]|nr:glycosyltransferase family 4 protein [Planctomycetota bacterium]
MVSRAEAKSRGSVGKDSKPRTRVLILNQYYIPDVAATGHLLHELAVELVKLGFEVEVLTGRPSYGPPNTWQDCPLRETADGVKIRRFKVARFDKNFLPGRVINYLTFVVPMILSMIFKSRRDTVYLYTTNPPFLGVIGAFVRLFREHHYVTLLHDAHPQLGVWVGTFKQGSLIERSWSWLNRRKYNRSRETIVLCKAAKRLVHETYEVPEGHIHVIPNWADGEDLFPMKKGESAVAHEQGFLDDFVLLYSGNMGLYYEFETVLAAAELLRDEPFKLVLVGGGGKKKWIEEEIERRGLTNTITLPYQPFERLNESLNACDASLVTIAKGIEGISFPSKLYTSLAVGKPIVGLSESRSELREIVERNECGVWCELGDAAGLAAKLRELIHNPALAARLGTNARSTFEHGYTREICAAKYADVLRLADPSRTPKERDILRAQLERDLAAGAAVEVQNV